MKRAFGYLFSVLLTVLFIFTLIAAVFTGIFRLQALQSDRTLSDLSRLNAGQQISERLTQLFTEQENTTGVPASVYAPYITPEKMDELAQSIVKQGFDYVNGRSTVLTPVPDSTAMRADLRAFFEQYAKDNGVKKDSAFEEALERTSANAELQILREADAFRFAAIGESGMLQSVRKYIPAAGWAVVGTIAVSAVLFILLLTLSHGEGLYFIGTGILIASLLMFVPSVWLIQTRYFDRFAVKSDLTFHTVTNYLFGLTETVRNTAGAGLILGLLILVLFGILRARRRRRETVRKAQH